MDLKKNLNQLIGLICDFEKRQQWKKIVKSLTLDTKYFDDSRHKNKIYFSNILRSKHSSILQFNNPIHIESLLFFNPIEYLFLIANGEKLRKTK